MAIKEPEQLDAGITMIGTASFGSQTNGIGSIMGSTWSEKIVFDAQPNRVLSKYFIEFNDLLGNNDVTIVIPKIGDINLMGGRCHVGMSVKEVEGGTNLPTSDCEEIVSAYSMVLNHGKY